MMVWLLGLLAHPIIGFALGNAKRDLGLLWTWLCHRSFWQLAFGAALLLAGWEYLGKRAEQRHSTKVEAQLSRAVEKLNAISSKRDQQKQETAERIKVVTRTIHDAELRAEKVEKAPLPGNCKSPPEVMGADL